MVYHEGWRKTTYSVGIYPKGLQKKPSSKVTYGSLESNGISFAYEANSDDYYTRTVNIQIEMMQCTMF